MDIKLKVEQVNPKARRWEQFYRNRNQYDKVVRSTHGVNCTGSCSWDVFVKNGIIVWEMQATDYPTLNASVPPYEPRGCSRGISASWYVYSPLRIKYPLVRGVLMDLWREAKARHPNPLEAWQSIVQDPNKRTSYQQIRGKGGFRRSSWDEVRELISASSLYTAKKYGPDRVIGFSPIPAMSYLSYAAGTRFLQLFGGVALSFYDWYSDLPPAFPEVWGEQTDVAESADWFNARYIVAMGSNVSVTRAPDSHFIHEARHEGTKFVVIAPEFNPVAKNSDWWIPVKAGQDNAMWMAVNQVILKEFHHDREVPFFTDYLKRYSDTPFLVELVQEGDSYRSGQYLRAGRISQYKGVENGEWKLLVFDVNSKKPVMPKGTLGFRWSSEKGKWNLKLEDGLDDTTVDPQLTFLGEEDDVLPLKVHAFGEDEILVRGVPVKFVQTIEGQKVAVATVYDILMTQFGVSRGLAGEYPTSYEDDTPFTPKWQEKYTGVGAETVLRLAREFAHNAEVTEGRSMIIIGTGVNHWYNNNLSYRSAITALIITGCVGRNGGGFNHYVGQEKAALIAPWSSIAFAFDWQAPPRLQQTPIWHTINADQWRYEDEFSNYLQSALDDENTRGQIADQIARAVRLGWMPFHPGFNKNPLDIVREAEASGAQTDEEIVQYIVNQLKAGELKFAVQDPDAEENWPRVWFIWRANALSSSAKGQEYFLRHYLGTDDNSIATERGKGLTKEVQWREPAPRGKMDLVVDINFRMDTSALYSDIVLPTAMWYEKNDLNTTDLHTFIHPLGEAVPPAWEAKSDWEIFKLLAKTVSELATDHMSDPVKDVVAVPLLHDTPAEIAQKEIKDWLKGECEAIPGKTMPAIKIVERDYTQIYQKFISYGRLARDQGLSAHGLKIPIEEQYDELLSHHSGGTPGPSVKRCIEWGGQKYPSLEDALDAANAILHFAPETNGEVAYKAYKVEEEKTGLVLADLAEKNRSVRADFKDITRQPLRYITSPCWSGIINEGRPYSAFTINTERLVPWRTLSGRQHLYYDHPIYLSFGENVPTYKPKISVDSIEDLAVTGHEEGLVLNFTTPHGKWQIHSTFYDTHRMRTLSRSIEPCWIHPKDADKLGIKDNEWVEIYNDHGVAVTRAAVSARVQPGTCMVHHSAERTLSVPKSEVREGRRGGVHNSLIRSRMKPVFLAGGYAQWTWFFNYWGPVGVNRDCFVRLRKLEKVEW